MAKFAIHGFVAVAVIMQLVIADRNGGVASFSTSIHRDSERLQVEKKLLRKFVGSQFTHDLHQDYQRVRGKQYLDDSRVFRAIWNVPSYLCTEFGVDLPLADYGIEYNTNQTFHFGDVLSIFGQFMIGLFPYIDRVTLERVNGGLVQLANITNHLEKATNDISNGIPDPKFDGLGILDWEWWYPVWDTEAVGKLYQDASLKHVREVHPEWDPATIELVAKLEWLQGAKMFMESTVELVKRMRPNATWGCYHYPSCGSKYDIGKQCEHRALNDGLMWLFNAVEVFYPSFYLPLGMNDTFNHVNRELQEAFRIRAQSNDPNKPVFAYTTLNYSHTDIHYSQADLNLTILLPAELGADGIVLWSDFNSTNDTHACTGLRDYLIKSLGPTVLMAKRGAEACSQRLCSGQGQCIGKILTCNLVSNEFKRNVDGWTDDETCSCRCFKGWEGLYCNKPKDKPTNPI